MNKIDGKIKIAFLETHNFINVRNEYLANKLSANIIYEHRKP